MSDPLTPGDGQTGDGQSKESTALIAIVLGIGSFVFSALLAPIGIVLGAAAILLGILASRRLGRRTPQPLIALALGIAGTGVSLAAVLVHLLR